MKRWAQILLWMSGTLVVLLCSSLVQKKLDQQFLTSIDIALDRPTEKSFISIAEVQDLIEVIYRPGDSLKRLEINRHLLEESIENHPSIEKAEVYSTLSGAVRVKVYQPSPLARWMQDAQSQYLLPQGATMPLSNLYSAPVPLLTGAVQEEDLVSIADFFNALKGHAFFKDFFTGLHVTEAGTWILYPRPGSHRVIIGRPDALPIKLEKLRLFYLNATTPKNIDSIASINLSFEDQVICTKKPKQ